MHLHSFSMIWGGNKDTTLLEGISRDAPDGKSSDFNLKILEALIVLLENRWLNSGV